MALTQAEQEELRFLQRRVAAEDAQKTGAEALDKTAAARQPVAPKVPAKRPFSLYRATVGGLRDAGQGMMDGLRSMGQAWLDPANPNAGAGGVFGAGPMGAVGTLMQSVLPRGVSNLALGSQQTRPVLPTLKGEEDAGLVEKLTRGFVSVAVPFAGWSKFLGVGRAASWLGNAGRAMLAGVPTDYAQADPVSGNIANTAKDLFGLDHSALDSLAAEEDDTEYEKRAKAALANAPLSLLGDAFVEGGSRILGAYRSWKGSAEEAKAIVDGMRGDIKIDEGSRNLPAVTDGQGGPKNPFETSSGAGAKATEDAAFTDIPKPQFDSTIHVSKEAPPRDFEDVVDYLRRQAGNPEIDAEAVKRFSDNLLFGDPENALAKMGIDPAKLDFSKFDDPDMLGRLQKGMAELYETFASKLGRSNLRVTEGATVSAARAFASTADVLKFVHGSTSNLAEELMGARMFVGAHAHKLLADADAAAEAIIKGTGGDAEARFLESFMRHAYYLGAVRGAGSEVGRALRSLQIIAKVGKEKAAKTVADAIENDAKAAGTALQKNRILEGASNYSDKWLNLTDAEKLGELAKLKALAGDVGELSRNVRRENMGILRRLDGALKETVGNLFTTGTGIYNAASGGVMLGSRVMERTLSMMARLALSPFGGKEAGVAARMATIDTWAYTHGILSGFGDAFRNTINVLEKEGLAEAALNADSMGMSKLAVKAIKASNTAADALAGRSFERADVKNYRNFAVLPGEMKQLQDLARSLPGPKFFQEALAGLVRTIGSGINAAGSLSRAGTILFVNLPDEFVGSIASRAGAYSYAVRAAANEAAELGLEGKQLSQFLKARAIQLAEHPAGWHPDGYDAGVLEAMGAHGEQEAREVLFQDDLQLGVSKGFSHALGSLPLMHLVVPFIKTPLRILERTALDYTPLALVKDSFRKAILQGGPARDEALARLGLGITAIGTAFALADDRQIVGNDGGSSSSARLGRSSYSLKIGDDSYEFNRVDPLGTLLGLGADMREFYRSIEGDADPGNVIEQATEAMLWSVTANMLSKTWLTSLKNLTDLAGATSDDDFQTRLRQFVQGFGTRFVPASGIQRQFEKLGDETQRQAMTFVDQLKKTSLGASSLPERRDPLLGRPVPLDGLDRLVGIRGGPGVNPSEDPLAAEIERLSFKLPGSRRTIEGVQLTAKQYSRYLELKGQVVKNPRTGLTLEQTLEKLIELPEYQRLPDAGRVDAVRREMEGYSRLATDQLIREDKDFARAALRQEVFDKGKLQGFSPGQSTAEYTRLGQQLGLIPSQ